MSHIAGLLGSLRILRYEMVQITSSTGLAIGAGAKVPVPSVMFLGDHFGYPSGVMHGVTSYFLNVLPALSAAGVDITACFLRDPHPAAAALRGSGIEPLFLSASPLDPFVVSRVASVAKERGCRIIHGCGIKATLVARLVARMVGASAIIHVHDLLYPKLLVSALHRAFSRSTDTGLCVSEAVRDVAINGYHVPPDRCRVVYNGIRIDAMRRVASDARSSLRKELQVADAADVIAMIGRMHPVKGHRGMVQMMPSILRSRPGTVLLLVGDGPERPACEALAARLGVQDHVRFLGQRTDIPELLSASDLVVMPSQSEGLGLAAIEALAAGKPVVAYGVSGLREVVSNDRDGKLVAAGDQNAFARAVVTLLEDRQLRESYSQYATVAAERFALERHIETLLSCYREIDADASAVKA